MREGNGRKESREVKERVKGQRGGLLCCEFFLFYKSRMLALEGVNDSCLGLLHIMQL